MFTSGNLDGVGIPSNRNNLFIEAIIPLCTPSAGYHFIIAINRGKVSQGWGVVGALYCTTCVSYDSHATTTKHAAAALIMGHNNLTMTSWIWQPNPPSIDPSTLSDEHPPTLLAMSHYCQRMCDTAGSKLHNEASIGTRLGGGILL